MFCGWKQHLSKCFEALVTTPRRAFKGDLDGFGENTTSAYMLVYIHNQCVDKVLRRAVCSVPSTLKTRMDLTLEKELGADVHPTSSTGMVELTVVTSKDLEGIGDCSAVDLFGPACTSGGSKLMVPKGSTFGQLREQVAKHSKLPVHEIRLWLFARQGNATPVNQPSRIVVPPALDTPINSQLALDFDEDEVNPKRKVFLEIATTDVFPGSGREIAYLGQASQSSTFHDGARTYGPQNAIQHVPSLDKFARTGRDDSAPWWQVRCVSEPRGLASLSSRRQLLSATNVVFC